VRRTLSLGALAIGLSVFVAGAKAQTLSIRPVFGGFPADAGFSAGAEISRTRMLGPIDGRVKAVASTKKYELLEAGIEVQHLGPWLYLGVTGRYRNYPEEDFWGLGPNTPETARTNYRFEDADASAVLGTAFGRIRTGVTGGYQAIHTGRGQDKQYPSTSGLSGPRYVHGGMYFEYKAVNNENDPTQGGRYNFQANAYGSRFQTYEVDLRQYFPLTATDRLAFRLQTSFTSQSSSQDTPFFMLPFAGGNDTIRGYGHYRFRDRNAMVLNGEYRRPLWKFVDMVGFIDAGRVFSNPGNLGLQHLHTTGGAGARLKLGGRVLFGFDVGVGPEGTHLWFRSGHTF